MKHQLTLLIALTNLLALALCQSASAQGKTPPRAELDAALENAVRQANSQLANTKIDDYTTLIFMTYDKGTPVFSYHYRTFITKSLGRNSLAASEKEIMREYHREKTCSSHFTVPMRVYGLHVSHLFEDGTTGKPLLSLTYRWADCIAESAK